MRVLLILLLVANPLSSSSSSVVVDEAIGVGNVSGVVDAGTNRGSDDGGDDGGFNDLRNGSEVDVILHESKDYNDQTIRLEANDKDYNNNNDTRGLPTIVQDAGGARGFALLMLSLTLLMAWILYASFYNSRVVGKILTWVVNRLLSRRGRGRKFRPQIHVGSFSLSFLSGKILFRDFEFITADYALRVQDGFIIFMWWRKVRGPGSRCGFRSGHSLVCQIQNEFLS